MKKVVVIKKFVEIALIALLFSACISSPSETTTSPTTTDAATTAPAQFEIVGLRVIPEDPKVGDTLTILVDVRNKGDSSGSYTVLVTIGDKLKTQNVELEGKSSKTVQVQEIADTEGSIEIKTGNLAKTIVVTAEEPTTTLPATTPPPTTPTPTTPPTTVPEEPNRIDLPAYELETRLNYLFTAGGNEWGSTIVYLDQFEETRNTWFRWGVTDHWNTDPEDTYWRGDYEYVYDRNWDLNLVWSDRIGGYTLGYEGYVLIYRRDNPIPDDWPCCESGYRTPLPNIYPLVKGAEKIDNGIFCLVIPGWTWMGGGMPEGRGTYERRIYVEDFEDIEAGGETYRCAKVRYYMRHTAEFLSPYYNEDWGKLEWIEEGYHWYSEFGLVKAEVTIKTYWWDELEKTDTVSIVLTGATPP